MNLPGSLDQANTFAGLPPEPITPPRPADVKLVVLDDDPTGTQTVHGVPVLTRWNEAELAAELRDPCPVVFLLTNTRALTSDRAVALNRQTGAALRTAARSTGRRFIAVSRSDSTLRGHFPAETDALAEALGGVDATFLVPVFFAGGRYTLGDVHYVADRGRLVPAGLTEFARDATFGYQSSNLGDWVSEKTSGRVRAEDVVSISLADLRQHGASQVAARLDKVPRGGVVMVNAVAPGDLAVLTQALGNASLAARRYLFRTAADFVSTYTGIKPRPLLTADELREPGSRSGGLLVAGSYVGKTTEQLALLYRTVPSLERVELCVPALLETAARTAEMARALSAVEAALAAGLSVALVTSRTLVTLVRALKIRPAWFIAKGGITSSDLATEALGVRRAVVLGQAMPDVPVWSCGHESKWPGFAYTVFPGNVGGPGALSRIIAELGLPRR